MTVNEMPRSVRARKCS